MTESPAAVRCEPQDGGWRCHVSLAVGSATTEHVVLVERATLEDLAPGATPEALVAESFRFLLEREPAESILRRFELPIIGRYFGEFTAEMQRRMKG